MCAVFRQSPDLGLSHAGDVSDPWRVGGPRDIAAADASEPFSLHEGATSASTRRGVALLCLCAAAYLSVSGTFWLWWSNQIRERALAHAGRQIHNPAASAHTKISAYTEIGAEMAEISAPTQVISTVDSAEENSAASPQRGEAKNGFVSAPKDTLKM